MINIASHIRIFDLNPSDDFVEKRRVAIESLSLGFGRQRSIHSIFEFVNDLVKAVNEDGKVSSSLVSKIETAICQSASAFVAEGEELQITVCGMLAMLHRLNRIQSSSKYAKFQILLAIALWSALSYQAPNGKTKLEALRTELLQAAEEVTLQFANYSRKRIELPNVNEKFSEKNITGNITSAFAKDLKNTILGLQANALLDREEINLLWWVMSDWSKLLDCRFSDIDNSVTKVISSGLEVGELLQEPPCAAHYHLVLRQVDQNNDMNLSELLQALGNDREILAEAYNEKFSVDAYPAIFPLSNSLYSGNSSGANAEIRRSLDEWAGRALLESMIVNITTKIQRL